MTPVTAPVEATPEVYVYADEYTFTAFYTDPETGHLVYVGPGEMFVSEVIGVLFMLVILALTIMMALPAIR